MRVEILVKHTALATLIALSAPVATAEAATPPFFPSSDWITFRVWLMHASAPAAPVTADALLDKVQRFYDQTQDFSADFIQTYTRVALSKTQEQRGTVQIKKPGMMRWDYTKPAPRLFVADGSQLIIYEPEEEQVIRDPNFKASELTSSIRFLFGKGALKEAFTAKLGDPKQVEAPAGTAVLELTPKSDATYRKLILIVDPASGRTLESVIHETSGNTNRFKFLNVKTNTGLKAEVFSFTPPPGVEIITRP